MLQLSPHSMPDDNRSRFFVATVFVLVGFGILVGRFWYLQILKGKTFQEFSEKNRITIREIPARRGRILDRNGVVLADSRPAFDLVIAPSHIQGTIRSTFDQVANTLNWTQGMRDTLYSKLSSSGRKDAYVIQSDLSRDDVARTMVRQYAMPGVQVNYSPVRMYPFETYASHLLGYLGEINPRDWKRLRMDPNTPYRFGDSWGISGLEKAYEEELRGVRGARPFIEDAWGRELGEESSGAVLPAFQHRNPRPGHDLVLSLDVRVQAAAEKAFKKEMGGAVVAIDPRNGDVLALMSRPEYVLENLVGRNRDRYWGSLATDERKPLYDRALRGLYPPGSTFKLVTALAALGDEVVDPEEKIFCNGYYRLGREVKRCWRRGGHGFVNFHKAIVQSCDVYFYEMGKRLGVNRIAHYAKELGLGEVTGIGINREEKGLVPTEEWKQRVYRQPWVGGETLSVAIGQGALQVTPIQLAYAVATFLSGGRRYKPRIVLRTQDIEGNVLREYRPEERRKVALNLDHRDRIQKGLVAVVQEIGGTAYWSARSKLVSIGGKTGTAQVVALRSGLKIEDHAWFFAFAPAENPKIVVSVIVEHGGHGGSAAAPIAKKVIEAYLGETS